MTPRQCVIFSRCFQTTVPYWHYRNGVSGDIASYLDGKENSHTHTHTHTCENIQKFIIRAILKCVNFPSGSSCNESQLYSAAAGYECLPANDPSRLSSVSPISKMLRLFYKRNKSKPIPLQDWTGSEVSRSLRLVGFKAIGT